MNCIFEIRNAFFFFLVVLFASTIRAESSDLNSPHPTSRVGAGLGNSYFGNFIEFQFRLYSHDLLNSDKGYIPFSESGKLNTSLRYYQNSNRIEVNKFSVLKLISLTPFNSLTDSLSYGLDLGLESVTIQSRKKELFSENETRKRITPLNGDFLFGYTYENSIGEKKFPLAISLLTGIKSQIHSQFVDFHRTGPQAAINFLVDFGLIKIQFISSYQYYTIFRNQNEFSNSLKFRYSINSIQEIRIDLNKLRYDQEIALSYIYMF